MKRRPRPATVGTVSTGPNPARHDSVRNRCQSVEGLRCPGRSGASALRRIIQSASSSTVSGSRPVSSRKVRRRSRASAPPYRPPASSSDDPAACPAASSSAVGSASPGSVTITPCLPRGRSPTAAQRRARSSCARPVRRATGSSSCSATAGRVWPAVLLGGDRAGPRPPHGCACTAAASSSSRLALVPGVDIRTREEP